MADQLAPRITVTKNGPYSVSVPVPLARQIIETDAEGQSREWREGETFDVTAAYKLCRYRMPSLLRSVHCRPARRKM